MNLAGRTALVTGGARGIGRELTVRLVDAGAHVVAVGRNPDHLDALRTTLAADADRLSTVVVDLADPAAVDAFLAGVRERHPDLLVVVNNAGVQRLTDFVTEDSIVTLPAMRHEVAVNLTAVVAVTAGLLPLLAAQPSSAVVNIASGLAVAPKRSAPVYCATKAAVRLFTRALRDQCRAGAPGVRVVDVVMPLVDTDMTRGRGRSAITAEAAARAVLDGLRSGTDEVYVGRAKVLRAVMRVSPALGYGSYGMDDVRSRRPGGRTVRLVSRLDAATDRRWFLPAVGLFPLADYAAPVLPNQVVLGALAALRPERWRALAAVFLGSAALGAVVVTAAVQLVGPAVLDALPSLDGVDDAVRWVEQRGLWALLALSLLPWPPRLAVVACALVGIPPPAIGAVVLVGRSVPVVATAVLSARVPGALRRFRAVDQLVAAVLAARAARPE